MRKSIVRAWLNVRSGLTKSDPATSAEVLRHPLFGNPSILNSRDTLFGVSGLSEGCPFTQSGYSRVKDIWKPERKEWKGLLELGINHHASNRKSRDIITASIPWRPDEYDYHIQVGDWIGKPSPSTGNPFDWVYLVLELTRGKTNVIEFKKTSHNGRIQTSALQALTISTANYQAIIVFS